MDILLGCPWLYDKEVMSSGKMDVWVLMDQPGLGLARFGLGLGLGAFGFSTRPGLDIKFGLGSD